MNWVELHIDTTHAGLEPVEVKEKRGWACIICKTAGEE